MWSRNGRCVPSTGFSMVKIVLLFLAVMLGLSMAGNAFVKLLRGAPPPPPPVAATKAKCGHCGREVIGTAPCVCGKG